VPLASTSSTTSIGLGLAISGATNEIIKVSITGSAVPPVAGTGIAQAIDGSVYFDTEYGSFFYLYKDANSTQWVQAIGSNTDGGPLDFPIGPAAGATYAAPNGVTYTFDGTKGVWTMPIGGGGGSGTVTSVTVAGSNGIKVNGGASTVITSSGTATIDFPIDLLTPLP
jgi:hypothetical protein